MSGRSMEHKAYYRLVAQYRGGWTWRASKLLDALSARDGRGRTCIPAHNVLRYQRLWNYLRRRQARVFSHISLWHRDNFIMARGADWYAAKAEGAAA